MLWIALAVVVLGGIVLALLYGWFGPLREVLPDNPPPPTQES